MSIYATLWTLKFPRHGDLHSRCDWIAVNAQGVPPHIGSPTPGCGYEDGNPYGAFLPPPVATDEDGDAEVLRAVVFVTEETAKGTARSAQEYVEPLYARITFEQLHDRICDALRGDRPRLAAELISADGEHRLLFADDEGEPVH